MSPSISFHLGRLSRTAAHAALSNSTATAVWIPAASIPKSSPPIPVYRLIAFSTLDFPPSFASSSPQTKLL